MTPLGGPKHTVAQNLCAQAAAPFEKFLGAWRERSLHPVTRPAFLGAEETNALHFEFFTDERIQIGAGSDHVAPRKGRRARLNSQRATKFIENFQRKECDLPLVIVFEVKIPILANATPCHAIDHWHLNHGIVVRLTAMMPDKIVRERNV